MRLEIKQAINRSKIKRFPYKIMLKQPLTSWLFKHFKGGYMPEDCIKFLAYEMKTFYLYHEQNLQNLTLKKALENMRISVSARYTEYLRKV